MSFLPGLNTEIEQPISPEERLEVKGFGFQLARLSALTCSLEDTVAMVQGTIDAGMIAYVNLADPSRMRHLPKVALIGVRNEDDGDLSPRQYRGILDDFCKVAKETGHKVFGGVGSNTDDDTMDWGEAVKGSGWPANLHGVEWHIYDPETNNQFARLKKLCGPLPLIIGEFGEANTTGYTEEWQAERIKQLWQIHSTNFPEAFAICLFQIHDGKSPNAREHRYGIRRCDANGVLQGWKPSAFVTPQSDGGSLSAVGEDMASAVFVISRAACIQQGNNEFTVPYQGGVLSVQPDGELQVRPVGTAGAWEKFTVDGNKAVFRPDGRTYAIPVVD